MPDKVLERLKQGARRFQAVEYPSMAEEYLLAAANPQQPHALIVACADSRVAVEKMISWRPGDVFITRNVGNMVPAYGEMLGAVSAVIEYAVTALNIRHIVVCGHSDCGAMKALLHPASVDELPTVKNWLTNGQAALLRARARCSSLEADMLPCLTEQNVLLQMDHLKTHPSVARAMAANVLTLSGWVYEIGSGAIRICEDGEPAFHPITD